MSNGTIPGTYLIIVVGIVCCHCCAWRAYFDVHTFIFLGYACVVCSKHKHACVVTYACIIQASLTSLVSVATSALPTSNKKRAKNTNIFHDHKHHHFRRYYLTIRLIFFQLKDTADEPFCVLKKFMAKVSKALVYVCLKNFTQYLGHCVHIHLCQGIGYCQQAKHYHFGYGYV